MRFRLTKNMILWAAFLMPMFIGWIWLVPMLQHPKILAVYWISYLTWAVLFGYANIRDTPDTKAGRAGKKLG